MSLLTDASLVLVPSAIKTGEVLVQKPLPTKFSDETGNYDGNDPQGSANLTFTRNSNASRINSSGLVEKVRTNLLLHSNTFNSGWSNTRSTESSGYAGYDGTNNAWKLEEDSNTGTHKIQQSTTTTGIVSASLYAKAAERSALQFLIESGGSYVGANFDLTNGSVQNSYSSTFTLIEATSTSVGNGWYRVKFAANVTSSAAFTIYTLDAGFNTSYTGTTGEGIYIQAGQYETGAIATDYIATTTSARSTFAGITVDGTSVPNVARLDYSGGATCGKLLLEPQCTALLQYSESFDNAYWTKANLSVSPNTSATLDPSGYYGADKLVENSSTSTHEISHAIFAISALPYTYSIFAKVAERSWIALSIQGQYTFFDVANGAVGVNAAGNTAKIESYGNGWYRCSITRTATAANNFGLIRLASADNTPSYAGDGTSGLYVWGANLTQTSYLQSYVPTLGASVTRLADSASRTNIANLIGQTEGTLFFECSNKALVNQARYFLLSDGTFNNRIDIYQFSEDKLGIYVATSGVAQVSVTNVILPSSGSFKFALAYANNDYVWYLNGSQIGTDTTGSVPSLDTALFSLNADGGTLGSAGNSPFKQALLFKTRLSNADLANLTAL